MCDKVFVTLLVVLLVAFAFAGAGAGAGTTTKSRLPLGVAPRVAPLLLPPVDVIPNNGFDSELVALGKGTMVVLVFAGDGATRDD